MTKMKFFHRTRAENAASILKNGFRDTTGSYMMNTTLTGVWVSAQILGENEGACGDAVLQIEVSVSERDLDYYEVKEEGKPHREWCFPASIFDNWGIVVAIRCGDNATEFGQNLI